MLQFGQEEEEESPVFPVSPEENPVENLSVELPSIDNWAASAIIPFLDLMDIDDVSDRRAALLAMEKGKSEENIAAALSMADAYFSLVNVYCQEVVPEDSIAQSGVALYLGKAKSMKEWLGI